MVPDHRYLVCDLLLGEYPNICCPHHRDEPTIRLNFETVQKLDDLITHGYKTWVKGARDEWKADGFLKRHSPIVITSRFGQDAAIAARGNEEQEAVDWDSERDYSKIAYLTIALATSIESVIFWLPHFVFVPQTLIFLVV